VGTATVFISEIIVGSICEIEIGDLETSTAEMAVSCIPNTKISSSLFLKICWEGVEQWAKSTKLPNGWYACKVVGVFATDKEGYYGDTAEVAISNQPVLFEGGEIVSGGIFEESPED
jgi:hypothetical protein